MNDCPNAAIRDQLPDLVHDQLDADARSAVVAHVAVCAECQAELSLLRQMRVVLSRERTIDVGQIVRALPSPPRAQRPNMKRPVGGGRRIDWRIAAAVAFLAVGGASVATYGAFGGSTHRVDGTPNAQASAGPASDSERTAPAVAAVPAGQLRDAGGGAGGAAEATHPAELAMADGYTDMSDSELQALLGEIDQFPAVPPAEPDPVTVRMTTGNPGSY